MTPEQYFIKFVGTLSLSDSARELISNKHNELREELRSVLPTEDDFLTGSYPRNTLICPKDGDKFDVDFFLAFSNNEYGEFELPKLLEMVIEVLKEIATNDPEIINIIEQNRSVAVEYGNGFQIDVVPAIEIERNKLYKIFDKRTRQPVKSNPKLHGRNLSEANEATKSGSMRRLVPIVKLLKSWKREKCDYVKSFHLELLALQILKDEKIETYSYGLNKFFSNAGKFLEQANLIDPANEENVIDAYLDEEGTRQELLDLIVIEKNNANLAYQNEKEDDYKEAIKQWKKVFEKNKSEAAKDQRKNHIGPTIITRPPKQHCNVQIEN